MSKLIKINKKNNHLIEVVLNRPEKLNSFNVTQRREFVRAAQEVNADRDIWVVVLTGALFNCRPATALQFGSKSKASRLSS